MENVGGIVEAKGAAGVTVGEEVVAVCLSSINLISTPDIRC